MTLALPIAAGAWDAIGPGLLVVAVVAVGVAFLAWTFRRGDAMLDRWAAENNFRLLESEYRWFAKGPFFWRSSKGQTVYRIAVEDQAGEVHRGWARCGGWFLGLWTDQVDVRWDEQPPARQPPGFPVILPSDRSGGHD